MSACPHCGERTIPGLDRLVGVPPAAMRHMTYRCRACRGRVGRGVTLEWTAILLGTELVIGIGYVLGPPTVHGIAFLLMGLVAAVGALLAPLVVVPEEETDQAASPSDGNSPRD